jgi:glutaminase
VRACEEVADTLNLHLLDATATASPVVTRTYTAAEVSSRRVRRRAEADLLKASGPAVTVLQLQGDLFFATAERLVRTVEQVGHDTQVVILDARRIGRATAGAVSLLVTLRDDPTVGPTILVAGAPESLLDALARHGGAWPPAHVVADVDLAIEQGEDIVLAARASVDGQPDAGGTDGADLLVALDDDDRSVLAPLMTTETYEEGDPILRAGQVADRLCLLFSGSATSRLDREDGRTVRLRTFGPGTVFGEAAVLEGGVRTVDVVANEPCVVASVTTDALRALEVDHPVVHAHLLAALGRYLSERLRQAVDEIRVLDA